MPLLASSSSTVPANRTGVSLPPETSVTSFAVTTSTLNPSRPIAAERDTDTAESGSSRRRKPNASCTERAVVQILRLSPSRVSVSGRP